MAQEKLSAELNYLKSQINPHFLFNTLNNLYALAMAQSPRTPDIILRLSDLMNYMIYDCTKDHVPLLNEVQFLKDFVELEKVRLDTPDKVSLQIDGKLEGKVIPPLLLMPFIENAFKHGLWNNPDERAFLDIRLSVAQEYLRLIVENSSRHRKENQTESSGFGLANIRRRLQLLYPADHDLRTIADNGTFLTNLKIPVTHA